MNLGRAILLRTFGRPQGLLGRIGGAIMARSNRRFAEWVIGLMEVRPGDQVLEIGFGPGVAIELLMERTEAAAIAGVDISHEMVEQACARNGRAIRAGRVDLRYGAAERLPFDSGRFDKALAINSLQVWPDQAAGLHEVARVLQPGGLLALVFTQHSGQGREGLPELLASAGFTGTRIAETEGAFCLMTRKPAA